ncbi:Helix-turn-helix domain-containing protein [Parapedobacter luteus]|uniref:Helix-turn-helix domain-containing protein n=1 Tax=Parapedobacter luteus TaxID=623280 RepID=A0A1T5BIZ5_9SPHI|nr:AraC family transcriptional regulator [Parapedobacter luteus]SKB46793.1 Helix-turn-helix domain-containing protein [Parapedobacter luteus]
MKIAIKNMVCPRCIQAVSQVFAAMGITPLDVRLGEVIISQPLTETQYVELQRQLEMLGFELLDDQQQQLVEKIKSIIIQHVHQREDNQFAFTSVLQNELHKEYSQLSKLFSEKEGVTIEHYVILQRMEKVKELLSYNELTLSEIAYRLGYSSVAYLSAQFKKITGLTPSQFKSLGINLRKPIDNL